jgi:hypothetical protein
LSFPLALIDGRRSSHSIRDPEPTRAENPAADDLGR